MKFFFTGGTGFIGNILVSHLLNAGHEITLLVLPDRKVRNTHHNLTIIEGNSTEPGSWQEHAAIHQVIVNLAGTSIFQRWNNRVKKAIYDSRILTTRNIVAALGKNTREGKQLFSASGVGYYGYHHDEVFSEESLPGDSFLARVAVDWEAEALKARTIGVRVVLCRFGIVLGKQGGALKRCIPLFKLHLSGSWGRGEQWFSWMHEKDLIESFLFLLAHRSIDGPVNFTAPNPVRNREMITAFTKTLRKKSVIRTIPRLLIQGMLGNFSEIFLKGQKVLPDKLLKHGYHFQFPTIKGCLENLLNH
jgi:uncharacterized protein (TIGR01777 family)